MTLDPRAAALALTEIDDLFAHEPLGRDFSFDGPADAEVLEGWRARLDRLVRLQQICGAGYQALRDEFLSGPQRVDHRSYSKVYCCIAVK